MFAYKSLPFAQTWQNNRRQTMIKLVRFKSALLQILALGNWLWKTQISSKGTKMQLVVWNLQLRACLTTFFLVYSPPLYYFLLPWNFSFNQQFALAINLIWSLQTIFHGNAQKSSLTGEFLGKFLGHCGPLEQHVPMHWNSTSCCTILCLHMENQLVCHHLQILWHFIFLCTTKKASEFRHKY